MTRINGRSRIAGLVLSTALVSTLVSGCSTAAGPRAANAASKAETALAKGKTDSAIANAEAAVQAEPNNLGYRAMLGSAYLKAGRFNSAVTSYKDAMSLGDQSARTALSLALAHVATGDADKARSVLDDWRDVIAPADLGLAYALAGEPDRGVMVLTDALRGGDNSPKVRQNLAYAYALAGQWRDARVMASQDVPGNQIDDRIGQWAASAHPEAFRERVAIMLGVPVQAKDPGQPTALALVNTPSTEQLAAEASTLAPRTAAVDSKELPAESDAATGAPGVTLARYEAPVTTPPQSFEAAFATSAPQGGTPAQVIADTLRFVSEPVVQNLPARFGFVAQGAKRSRGLGTGTHLVQLGSFASEAGARRAWGMYTARHPELLRHELKITPAQVKGRQFWRVSATGFDRLGAISMCSQVQRSSKDGCIAYSFKKPLPGTVG